MVHVPAPSVEVRARVDPTQTLPGTVMAAASGLMVITVVVNAPEVSV